MAYKENWSANDRRPSFVAWSITEVKDTFVRNDTGKENGWGDSTWPVFCCSGHAVWRGQLRVIRQRLVEWKRNLVAHGDAREEKWRGKRRMEWVAKLASVWLGTVHPVLLQSFSADPHSKKAITWLNWHPRRYKWTRPFRWKTESGFCACAITFRLHYICHGLYVCTNLRVYS